MRRAIFAPTPKLTVSEWAESHRHISPEHNPEEPGPWSNRRVPYLTEIMDALSDPAIERVVFKKASRVGGTEVLNNFVGYIIDQRPRPTMVVLPTVDEAKGWSKETLDPMLRDTRRLRGRVRDSDTGRRQKSSTIQLKMFAGGYLVIVGSNAAAGLRRRSIANVLMSEVDGFGLEAKGGRSKEGDPVALAVRRSHNVRSRKIYLESSTTEKGQSRISREYSQSDQREYFMPCPHCGYMQTLKWWNLKYENDEPSTVAYMCGDYEQQASGEWKKAAGCGAMIQEHQKQHMLDRGQWRPKVKGRGARGYFIWSAYSPLVTWARLVDEWIKAQGDRGLLKTFVNTVLGEEWEDSEGTELNPQELRARRERYAEEVPRAVGLVTAGVDVQGDRLEASVWGWADGEEAYVIHHEVLVGNPGQADVWNRLDLLLQRDWRHASGGTLRIAATTVDTGGHFTDEAYAYCGSRRRLNVYAIKGSNVPGALALGKMTIMDKTGARFFMVGVNTLKDSLSARLVIPGSGPRYIHFAWDLPDDYFEQLTSERRRPRYVNRRLAHVWELPAGQRNEALDCGVYALAALYILGPTVRASLAKLAAQLQEGKSPVVAPTRQRGVRHPGVQL